MTHAPGPVVTAAVSSISHHRAEKLHGITLPSFAAMLTRLYSQKFGLTDAQRLQVAVKNHSNGVLNPHAHFRKEITLEKALNSPIIADPLRLFDCCPRSDGAAAIVMMDSKLAESYTDSPVYVVGSGQATDLHIVHERPNPLELSAVRIAAEKAFSQANLTPKDVDIVELHDAFSILEFVQAEQSGFFENGEYITALEDGKVYRNGELPINVSGGLKARGHPLGATGTAQVCEIIWQLQKKAGDRQVPDPRIGFACNFGGFGNNVVSHLFSNELRN
jgi:acetyl-CoA C-acetyltransferase